MSKSRIATKKTYTFTITAPIQTHKLIFEMLKRLLYTERKTIFGDPEITCETQQI